MRDECGADTERVPRASWACLIAALVLLILLVVPGIRWGVPSETRNRLAFGPDRSTWRAPEGATSEFSDPWTFYPNALRGGAKRTGHLPRSAFNPIRSYHPDEYAILKSLKGMSPSQCRFFHGFFGWPAFHIYVVGGAFKVASLVGMVTEADADFYFQNPDEAARLYVVGRLVTLLFGLACIVVTWRVAHRLFGAEAAGPAALLLATVPLFGINAHYMTADVPMLFWIAMVLLMAVNILKGGGRRAYILAGVFLGLAAGTRYQGALAAFGILTAHVLRKDGHDARPSWAYVARACRAGNLWIAAGVSVVVFLVVNPYILPRLGGFSAEFVGELRGSRNPLPVFQAALLFAESGLGIALTTAMLGALWMAVARRNREILFVILGLGVPAILLAGGRPVMVRYMMPVLLLPVLMTAWAFSVIHRQGKAIGKRMARMTCPLLLGFLILVTGWQSWAACALFADSAADTRTRAGEWIADHVPSGATVGLISEPWQFEAPSLDKKRFKCMILGMDPLALDANAPDVFVSSDLQFPPVAVRGPLTQNEEAFRVAVFTGTGRYAVVKRFEAWPMGRKHLLAHGPHDMRYANPVIVISRRIQDGIRFKPE